MAETISIQQEQEDQLVTVRSLNEYVYCPRLHHLMFVQHLFSPSADTVEGSSQHQRAAKRRKTSKKINTDNETTPDELPWNEVRELELSSAKLSIIGRLDAVRSDNGEWLPVEAKHGNVPDSNRPVTWEEYELPKGAWAGDQVQLCAQGLLLRDAGFDCTRGLLYYRETRKKVEIPFTPVLIDVVHKVIAKAQEAFSQPMPPPLVDSPKCLRCSLNHICMPDECNLLRHATEKPPRRIVPGRPDGGVVYLTTQGATLRIKQKILVIESSEGDTEHLPLKDVADVAIFGNIQVTTQCLNRLMRDGRSISYHSLTGSLNGIAHGLGTLNVELRHRQFVRFAEPNFALPLARELIKAKLINQRTLLRRNAERHDDKLNLVLNELQDLANAASQTKDKDVLLGLEGRAARIYFSALNSCLREQFKPAFSLEGRNRRPPLDPVNALLSFGYSLLLRDAWSAVARVGFDPMYGFYHALRPGRPALALDLMEPFRPLIVDSILLRVVNSREIQENHFIPAYGGIYLNDSGRKVYFAAYERRLNELITHPIFGYRISYRRVLEVEARILARVLEDELPGIAPLTTR